MLYSQNTDVLYLFLFFFCKGFLSTCNMETVLQQIDEHMNTGEVVAFASQVNK